VRAALADGTIDVVSSGHDPRGAGGQRLPVRRFAEPEWPGPKSLAPADAALVRDGLIDNRRAAFSLLGGQPARLLGVEAGRNCREGAEPDIAG